MPRFAILIHARTLAAVLLTQRIALPVASSQWTVCFAFISQMWLLHTLLLMSLQRTGNRICLALVQDIKHMPMMQILFRILDKAGGKGIQAEKV